MHDIFLFVLLGSERVLGCCSGNFLFSCGCGEGGRRCRIIKGLGRLFAVGRLCVLVQRVLLPGLMRCQSRRCETRRDYLFVFLGLELGRLVFAYGFVKGRFLKILLRVN